MCANKVRGKGKRNSGNSGHLGAHRTSERRKESVAAAAAVAALHIGRSGVTANAEMSAAAGDGGGGGGGGDRGGGRSSSAASGSGSGEGDVLMMPSRRKLDSIEDEKEDSEEEEEEEDLKRILQKQQEEAAEEEDGGHSGWSLYLLLCSLDVQLQCTATPTASSFLLAPTCVSTPLSDRCFLQCRSISFGCLF